VVSLGIFSVVPPTEPCALRSTQPLKVSTRDFSWGKGGRCVWLTTYHPCSAETSRKSRALIYPEPLRPPRPVAGHLYFTLHNFKSGKYSYHKPIANDSGSLFCTCKHFNCNKTKSTLTLLTIIVFMFCFFCVLNNTTSCCYEKKERPLPKSLLICLENSLCIC